MTRRTRERVREVRKTPDVSDSGPASLASRRPHTASSGCRRLMFNARHAKSYSPRALSRPPHAEPGIQVANCKVTMPITESPTTPRCCNASGTKSRGDDASGWTGIRGTGG